MIFAWIEFTETSGGRAKSRSSFLHGTKHRYVLEQANRMGYCIRYRFITDMTLIQSCEYPN
jgi:hypothetical protein